ncbi:MAG TPA: FAD synthetase family protein [Candidatus Limnocylindrales bacterium]|nr:FAD synthetase family protein [Candidatus Limnocylindrales bacterium]
MDVVQGVDRLGPAHGRLFVVVGVFDGLHRGHAYLLRRLVREAGRRNARPAVITFDHHPDEVLTGTAPPLLIDPEERVARLARAGVAVTVVQQFDAALRATPYDAFVAMITTRAELAGFLMTPDAAFGYERRGTPATLAELGRTGPDRFDVAVVPPLYVDGAVVRSSDIRAAIAAGDLDTARGLLGRRHAIVGEPGEGSVLRTPMPVALPPEGQYAARIGRPLDGHGGTGRLTVVDVRNGAVRVVGGRPRGDRVRVAFAGSAVGG